MVGTEAGRYQFLLFLLRLYTRLRKKEILDDFNRGRIMGYIEANPGVYYTDIMTTLDMNNGTLAYHLNVLEKERLIVSHREGVYRIFHPRLKTSESIALFPKRFFSTGSAGTDFKPSTLQQKVIDVIEDLQGITQVEIAETLVVSKQSLNYHIKKLRRAGVITVKKEKGNTRCFTRDPSMEAYE